MKDENSASRLGIGTGRSVYETVATRVPDAPTEGLVLHSWAMVVGPAATARAQTQAVVKAVIMISRKALPTTTKLLEVAAWFGILTDAFVPVVHTHAKAKTPTTASNHPVYVMDQPFPHHHRRVFCLISASIKDPFRETQPLKTRGNAAVSSPVSLSFSTHDSTDILRSVTPVFVLVPSGELNDIVLSLWSERIAGSLRS